MKVLLVVDMQNGFLEDNRFIKLKEKISELVQKPEYEQVVFTKFINCRDKNNLFVDQLKWNGLTSIKDQQICVDIPDNSVVCEKYGYGLDCETMNRILSMNVDSIDICGYEASACVYTIALQIFDRGIFPNILANYIGYKEGLQNLMHEIFIAQFGKVDDRD